MSSEPRDDVVRADECEPVCESPDVLTHERPDAPPPGGRVTTLANVSLMLAVVVLAGLTPVAAKDAVAEMPPLTTGFLRFSVAAVLMLLTHRLRRGKDPKAAKPIDRRHYSRFLLAAVLCVPVNQFCFLTGVKWSGAAHAGLLYALNPMLVYLLTLLLGQAAWSRRMGLAGLLAFVGAGTIGWESLHLGDDPKTFLGDVLLFITVASWAGYSITVTPLATRYGAVRSAAIVLLLGSLLYSPAYLIDGHELNFLTMSWRALAGFGYIAVLTSYLNYMLIVVALTRIDINRFSIGINGAPLVAVLGAYLWHNEPITRWLALGAALILSAITLANWDRIRALRTGTPSC